MSKNLGFTMAEILLSLTIIGVVAAITLPSLMANINERTWNTQRKALYARMSQAIAMMPQVGGYGTLTEDESGSVTADTAAETFLTEGLSKVLKINNICDSDHLADCGITSNYTTILGASRAFPKTMKELNVNLISASYSYSTNSHSYSAIDTKAAAFETQNGESVLAFYNPYCINNDGIKGFTFTQPYVCANFVYDLNGNKGPNIISKDIGFITVLYDSESSVIAPMPYKMIVESVTSENALSTCSFQVGENYRLPSLDESVGLFVNSKLLDLQVVSNHFFTSSKKRDYNGNIANIVMANHKGQWRQAMSDANWDVVCVER